MNDSENIKQGFGGLALPTIPLPPNDTIPRLVGGGVLRTMNLVATSSAHPAQDGRGSWVRQEPRPPRFINSSVPSSMKWERRVRQKEQQAEGRAAALLVSPKFSQIQKGGDYELSLCQVTETNTVRESAKYLSQKRRDLCGNGWDTSVRPRVKTGKS